MRAFDREKLKKCNSREPPLCPHESLHADAIDHHAGT